MNDLVPPNLAHILNDPSTLFIPYNVPSSKNSRQFVKPKGADRGYFIVSKTVKKYRKNTEWDWKSGADWFRELVEGLEQPYEVGFHFVRSSKRKWDFINPVQTLQDEMVKYNWFEDDVTDIINPFPFKINGKTYHIDKSYPGVFIKVFENIIPNIEII